MAETCRHENLYWFAAPADERGWRCIDCKWQPGDEPGYSPQHDRDRIGLKVGCILHDMHDHGIIYVSNSSCGEDLTSQVVGRCCALGVYDSVSIALFILEQEASERHRKFWKDQSDAIAGRDPRSRCWCGAIATSFTYGGPHGKITRCQKHSSLDLGEDHA